MWSHCPLACNAASCLAPSKNSDLYATTAVTRQGTHPLPSSHTIISSFITPMSPTLNVIAYAHTHSTSSLTVYLVTCRLYKPPPTCGIRTSQRVKPPDQVTLFADKVIIPTDIWNKIVILHTFRMHAYSLKRAHTSIAHYDTQLRIIEMY